MEQGKYSGDLPPPLKGREKREDPQTHSLGQTTGGGSPSSLAGIGSVVTHFTHLPAGRADWMPLAPPTVNRCIEGVEL